MKWSAILLCSVWALAGWAQTVPATTEPAPSGVLLASVRTQNHLKYSDSSHFNQAVDEIESFLTEQHVITKTDPVRGKFRVEATMSKDSVLCVAQDVGAAYALYFAVDRPQTRFIALTMQCFDLQGNMLWEFRSDHGMPGSHVQKAVKKLTDKLAPKVGSACLPVGDTHARQATPAGK